MALNLNNHVFGFKQRINVFYQRYFPVQNTVNPDSLDKTRPVTRKIEENRGKVEVEQCTESRSIKEKRILIRVLRVHLDRAKAMIKERSSPDDRQSIRDHINRIYKIFINNDLIKLFRKEFIVHINQKLAKVRAPRLELVLPNFDRYGIRIM